MEASPISVKSNDSGYSSNCSASSGYSSKCSSSSDLPSSSYDGSHLHWKSFRNHVLGAHRIQILDSAPRECIPDTFLALVETRVKDLARFNLQKANFREQVAAGRAFGPSPLFPPNILPPFDKDHGLAQCMLPSFSREALPLRRSDHKGPLYELSVPRSNLGCGFSASEFTHEELQCMPSFMVPTGTVVSYATASISPGVAIYSPFLTFERAHAFNEHRIETANNQCALAGAWCVRAMHLLQAGAFPSKTNQRRHIAFSCAIDNSLAIINLHWSDEKETYSMSPICKFDLAKDEHLGLFLIWIEAIGIWAVQNVLPDIKNALQRLLVKEPTPPPTPEEKRSTSLTLNTGRSTAEKIMHSLKSTFDDVPWRYDSEDCTPVSSSTASWGSPVNTDIQFSYSAQSDAGNGVYHYAKSEYTNSTATVVIPRSPQMPSPDLLLTRRLSHAMDEIRDLHAQIHILKTNFHNAANSTQSELGAVKVTLASMLRKENLMSRTRSLSAGNGAGLGLSLSSSTEIWCSEQPRVLPSSPRQTSLCQCLSTKSLISPSSVPEIFRPESQRPQLSPRPSPLTFSSSNTSAEETTGFPDAPKTASSPAPEPSPGLPPTPLTSRTMVPPTPYTPYMLVPPPPPEYSSRSIVKWSAITFSAHMAASFIPIMSLRIVVLGMITEAALLGFSSPHYGVSWDWMMDLVHRRR